MVTMAKECVVRFPSYLTVVVVPSSWTTDLIKEEVADLVRAKKGLDVYGEDVIGIDILPTCKPPDITGEYVEVQGRNGTIKDYAYSHEVVDHVICTNCSEEMYTRRGKDVCPHCGRSGYLMWASKEQEVNRMIV